MTRQTSIDVYHQIKDNGLLSKLRWEVYDFVFKNGPCTAKDLDLALRSSTQSTGVYTTRLSELRDAGVLEEVGETACKFTGHTVILWDVTASLPRKLEKDKLPTRNELIDALCTKLSEALYHLTPDHGDLTESSMKLIRQCDKYRKKPRGKH